MKISLTTSGAIDIVELTGDVDANTAPKIQQSIIPLIKPQSKIILNLTNVPYMSSAGLRMLLSLYRQTDAKKGQLILVGLAEEIKETMTITGFLSFFMTYETIALGLSALQAPSK